MSGGCDRTLVRGHKPKGSIRVSQRTHSDGLGHATITVGATLDSHGEISATDTSLRVRDHRVLLGKPTWMKYRSITDCGCGWFLN